MMTHTFYKSTAGIATMILLLAGCGPAALISTPVANIDTIPLKISPLTDEEQKTWAHADLIADTIPGMSVDKAYAEIIGKKKGAKVIVAVVDSGIDLEHEDLDGVLWTNTKEIPNNGKDDDGNGYVDDIHGYNFLGESYNEQLEYVRMARLEIGDASTLARINTKQQKEYEFNGYYWSYIRNSISNVPFQLKITYPIFSKNNSKAIVSASIENFHDRTLPEHYSGFGYFGGEMNNLFIELHSQTESTFKDAVYLILSVGGNLEEMDKNLIRGILTGVSASEGSRPILSMEVILLNKNADNYLISKAKTYLHLHKYSIRVRSANLNDKFPVLSGKLDVSNFTKKIKDEFKNYTYYHFDLNKEVVCGTIKFDYAQHQLCTITNYCYDIVLNPSVNECHYRFDINQGNTDLIINDYSSRRDRELRMEIRIRWSPRRNKSKIMSGTCIMYENDIFFPSPIILYPTNSNNIIRKKLSFEEFLNEIKSLHGEEEHQRLLKSLKLIYNKEILSILHLDET